MLSLKPHPNLIKVFGLCQEPKNFSVSNCSFTIFFSSFCNLITHLEILLPHLFQIVMELITGGSLDKVLEKMEEDPTEDFIVKVAYGIAKGMASLAEQNVIHRGNI